MATKDRSAVRKAVHKRVRRKVQGTKARPRLAIYRSLNHIYAQIIDDEEGRTLAAASTTEKDLRDASGGNIDAAARVGKVIAERALNNGITRVVFDRGGYRFHGRVRRLAEAAREAGLNKDEAAVGSSDQAADEANEE